MANELYEFKKEDAERFAQGSGIDSWERGGELHFKYCPYCNGGKNHDKKTFAINLSTGAWNCKRGSCGKSGNMITLAQDFDWFSLGDDGVDDYYLKQERYRKFLRRPVEVKDRAIEYMKGRCIPEAITRKYEITIKKDTDNILVFPFMDEKDDMWFVKYRNLDYAKGKTSGSKEWCEPGRKPILFGMNHCNFENKTLIMTEGQIDSLSCAASGLENAVSVPTGKNGFTWYPYCFNFLSRFDELIVFGDYEDGEMSLLQDMRTRFRGVLKRVMAEDYRDCKDANEILVKHGKDAVRQCINNAEVLPIPELKKFKDIQRMSLKDLDFMTTGISAIDKKCKFYFGELIVLTGAAGDGKSTMASQWATKAIDQGYSVMIYSGEMQGWLVKDWIDFQIVGKHNLNSRNDIDDKTYQKMVESDMYQRLDLYDPPDDDNDSGTQDKLINTIMKGIKQYGIRFILIDNLMTVMDYDGKLELNSAQTIYVKKLARIAENHGVIIVLIVHPRKNKGASFSNDDIAGSSNIVNRAHKTIRYSRMTKEFTDKDGKFWTNEEVHDAPIREMTVLKDRLTGNTIQTGIPLYFEAETKRISDNSDFSWRLQWENSDGFYEPDDFSTIPF